MVQLSRTFNNFGLLFVFVTFFIFHFSFYFSLVDSEIKIDKMSYKQKKKKQQIEKKNMSRTYRSRILSQKENGLIMNCEFQSF